MRRYLMMAAVLLVSAMTAGTGYGQHCGGCGTRGALHNHFSSAAANVLGGSNCGRGYTQTEAEALWSNYCFEDCTLNTGCGGCGHGCGGAGFAMRGGRLFGGRSHGSEACDNSCGNRHARPCGIFSRHGNGVGGGSGFAGACCDSCFGWPQDCGCNASGGLLSSWGNGRCARSGRLFSHEHHCGRSCGNCGGILRKLHNLVHHRDNCCDDHGGLFRRLHGCGSRCGFFGRHQGVDNGYGAAPITSTVRGCGCDGSFNIVSPTPSSAPVTSGEAAHPSHIDH